MVVIIKQSSSKRKIEEALKKLRKRKGFDAQKYCGVIKLKEHPLSIQKKLRDEWE